MNHTTHDVRRPHPHLSASASNATNDAREVETAK